MLWRLSDELKQRIKVLMLFLAARAVCGIFGISCLVYELTSVPCPTCYMTRALISLAKGDVAEYMMYNAMALPVAAVFMLELFNGVSVKLKIPAHLFCAGILIVNFIYYVHRFHPLELLIGKIL